MACTTAEPAVSKLAVQVGEFISHLRRRGLAPGTIETYGSALRGLTAYAAAKRVLELEQLDRPVLEGWQDQLVARGLAPKSRSIASTAARQLLLWASDRDVVDMRLLRAIAPVRTPARLPRPIPLADLREIQAYFALPRRRPTLRLLRDRALFTTLLVTGARISEVLQLHRSHFTGGRPIIVRQKGGREKELFLTDTAREHVRAYLEARTDDQQWAFVTVRPIARRLRRELVRIIWRRLAKILGIPTFTSHQIRHTTATELKRAGISDLVVANHLGHANLATLANYAAVVDEHREAKTVVLETLLTQGVDGRGVNRSQFRRPAKVRGRPDNRKSKVKRS